MGFTNFPNGVTSFGVPTMGMAGIPPTSGSVWFVNSNTGVDGNAGTFSQPIKTTARAIVLATAGDVIVWMAGHAETISAAGGITVNKAGLTFWGIGEGKDAPTFTSATSTAATFLISSANTVIGGNVNTICNIASQVTFFSVTAANVSITTTHYETSSTVCTLIYGTASAAALNLSVNTTFFGFTANALSTAMWSLVGVVDGNIVVNAYGAWSTAVVNFIMTACVNIQISGYFYNFNTAYTKSVVDTITGSTWSVQGFDGIAASIFDGGSGKAVGAGDISAVTAVQESSTFKAAALLTNGRIIFAVAGGPIEIQALVLVCVVGGDATAATVQFSITPTSGSAQTISAASSSVANAAAGASVALAGTALATAALYNANGPNLMANPGTIFCPAGNITLVVASGPTVTGTWAAYIRYKPMVAGVTVS